jgi:hypothetical protein
VDVCFGLIDFRFEARGDSRVTPPCDVARLHGTLMPSRTMLRHFRLYEESIDGVGELLNSQGILNPSRKMFPEWYDNPTIK